MNQIHPYVAGLLTLFTGILFLYFGVGSFLEHKYFYENSTQITGEIVSYKSDTCYTTDEDGNDESYDCYYRKIAYPLPTGGTHQFLEKEGQTRKRGKPGDPIEVIYLTDEPTSARVYSSLWFIIYLLPTTIGIMLSIFGAMFFLLVEHPIFEYFLKLYENR